MRPHLPVRIAGTATVPPGRVVSTAELAASLDPPRDADDLATKTGIRSRGFCPPDASPAALAASALGRALDAAGIPAADLARIIFVTSGVGDLACPANANLVAAHLELAGTCDCFDLNNACMGFLTALDVAARCIATGSGPIGITVAEVGSRVTGPDDLRPYVVFADAFAAAVVAPARNGGGILGARLWNDGIAFGNVRLNNAVITRKDERIHFTAPNRRMGEEAVEAVCRSAHGLLSDVGSTIDEVDWVLPHQPNGPLLDAMVAALGVPRARVVPVVHDVGSVGAASIPVSLARLAATHGLRAGERILMVGVGAGLSSGALLYEVVACASRRISRRGRGSPTGEASSAGTATPSTASSTSTVRRRS
jgi:3-oxoacyl-(acyl-carrier-protein) synthase III